jgi:hypothetical protein
MESRERTKTVKFPVFSSYEVEIVLAQNPRTARTRRDRTYGVFEGVFHSLHSATGSGKSLIVLMERPKVSEIAHETWHAVCAMMHWAGISFDNECMAYHIGFLTQQIYDFANVHSK